MRLRHIEVFNAVYTTGSISAAARLLNVSQPSVSKVLRHAEDQLGFQLFDRVRNGLVATAEAHLLFGDVEKVFDHLTRLQRSARNLKDRKSDHIRIAMITGLGFNVTPLAIAKFSKRYPDVTFELITEHYAVLCSTLIEHRADIGLVFQAPSHPNLKSMELGIGELHCVYPKLRFAQTSGRLRLEQIIGQPFVAMNENGPLGSILETALREQNNQFAPTCIAETGFVAASLVSCGLGVTIVDEFTARAVEADGLEHQPLTPPIQFSVNGLYSESHPLSKTCKEFFKCFRTVFRDIQVASSSVSELAP